MDAHEKTIKQIIEGNNQYIIPFYQRAYQWTSKNWKDLWDDLLFQYENRDSHKHFLGSIVTSIADAGPGEVIFKTTAQYHHRPLPISMTVMILNTPSTVEKTVSVENFRRTERSSLKYRSVKASLEGLALSRRIIAKQD